MKQIFNGIYSDGKNIYTKNLLLGERVYGEKLIKENSAEYRQWDAFRSKYGAAIKNGLKESIFIEGEKTLYLGSAEGTTVSHVSDIIGNNGIILCVDLSEIAMVKLTKLAEKRQNILPILSDAEQVKNYSEEINSLGKVDSMFQDISLRNQAEIFCKNSVFLKKGGLGALALKTKSISQGKEKEKILDEEINVLKKEFEIIQTITLEPFEKHHYLILVKKK